MTYGTNFSTAVGELTDYERGWLVARWLAFNHALESAPSEWLGWCEKQLTEEACFEWEAASSVVVVEPRESFDRIRDERAAEAFGQVFTPPELAQHMSALAGVGRDEATWPSRLVLDPACGDGSLLLAVVRRRHACGWSVLDCLRWIEGWDRDPIAGFLCKLTLLEWALSIVDDEPSPDRNLQIVCGFDSLQNLGRPGKLLSRTEPYARGVGLVISNPPYLEAKRMRRAEPGLRERLKQDFPKLTGAFDLYLAFCWRALEQIGEGGVVSLLIPNKVLQGRYATTFRKHLLENGSVQVERIVDMSRMKPPPFKGRSVYPIILQIGHREVDKVTLSRVLSVANLFEKGDHTVQMSQQAWSVVGGEQPLFVPRSTWPLLMPLFDGHKRLRDVAKFVSTCSFHRRGLREQYVSNQEPAQNGYPYLGGPSRSRKNEVRCFAQDWKGWWIRYDEIELKQVHRNALPKLQKTFLRPKLIIAQHALRLCGYADFEGRFVTKDVYPVGWAVCADWTLGALAAVINSTVFTALYNTIFHGVTVGGETYHYLPAFLHLVPVPEMGAVLAEQLENKVRAIQEDSNGNSVAWDELDRIIAAAYGVSETGRQALIAEHLERVGAASPTPESSGVSL